MFRRFMIVCWVLFSITAIISVASFIAFSNELPPVSAVGSAETSIDPEVLANLQEQSKLRHLSKSTFGQTAYMTRAFAVGILLWNVLCHTVRWIFKAESRLTNKIKENWRPLLILAAVVWGVFALANTGSGIRPEEYASVLGPFVIATAIYLLFPKAK